MRARASLIPTVAVALLTALPASGQVAMPSEGAYGTVIDIAGKGFGTKPTVYLTQEGSKKKRKLKVLEASDTAITAELRVAPAGVYALVVDPKGNDAPPQVAKEAFTVRLAEVQTVSQPTAMPGDEIEIMGSHFGTKKAKVKVGGKPAKVLEWEAGVLGAEGKGAATDRALLRLSKSKKTYNGPARFEIKGPSGTSESETTVTLTGGSLYKFNAQIDGKGFQSITKLDLGIPGYLVSQESTQFIGAKNAKTFLQFVLYDFDPTAEGLVLPLTFLAPDGASFYYSEGVGPGAKIWATPLLGEGEGDGEGSFITITDISAEGQVTGFGQAPALPGYSQNVQGTSRDVTNIDFSVIVQPE